MALSNVTYAGDGSTNLWTVTFGYLSKTHVTVTVDGVSVGFTWESDTTISLDDGAAALDAEIIIRRNTPISEPLTTFVDGQYPTATNLNNQALQTLYRFQETTETSIGAIPNASLENAKLEDMPAATLKGRRRGLGTGVPQDLAALHIRQNAFDNEEGRAETAHIADGASTNPKLANMAQGTLKGRLSSGAGAPEDLTREQFMANWSGFGFSGYDLSGLGLANDSTATDVDHDLEIAAGSCLDGTRAKLLTLSALITKQVDAAWAVGDDQGGMDSGTVAASTPYAVWLIMRSDTGVVDVLFSLSFSAPTMPAGYDYKRRIGFFLTDGSANIRLFKQNGSRYELANSTADVVDSTITDGVIENTARLGPNFAIVEGSIRVSATSLGPSNPLIGYIRNTRKSGAADQADEAVHCAPSGGTTSLARIAGRFTVALDASGIFGYGASEAAGTTTVHIYIMAIEDKALGWGA